MEPFARVGEEATASFMERVLVALTVTCAAEDISGTIVESDFNNNKLKLQVSLVAVIWSRPDTRSVIEHVLANIRIMTKVIFEVKVDSPLTKSICNPRSHKVKAVLSTFEDTLQTSYFHLNIDSKSPMFKVLEYAHG